MHCLMVAVHNENGATYYAHVVLDVRESMYHSFCTSKAPVNVSLSSF